MGFSGSTRHRSILVCNRQGIIHDVLDVLINRAYEPCSQGRPMDCPGGPGYTWWHATQECLQKLSELPPERIFQEEDGPNHYDQ